MHKKIYTLLGLMRKANEILIGEESCKKCIQNGRIKFVLVAEDASFGTRDKIVSACNGRDILYRIFGEKEVIGKFVGKGEVAVIGTNNEGFLKKLVSMIDDIKN